MEGIKSWTLYLSITKDNATNSSIAESSINNRMDWSRSHGYVPAPHESLFLMSRPPHGSQPIHKDFLGASTIELKRRDSQLPDM